ncbi:hypothetical protein F4678DRAFT_460989 [Xylaria arbuscula]|nr:hypothetical protein F4678DRAFT_460989 [Xylaria arbuscula]
MFDSLVHVSTRAAQLARKERSLARAQLAAAAATATSAARWHRSRLAYCCGASGAFGAPPPGRPREATSASWMDPLTIVGAAASVGQLVDLADKAATSAWNLTHSIIRAPKEVAKLAEKLERFKLLVEQTRNQTLDASSIDELFPSSYRDIVYKLLESNVNALENLESLQQVPSIGSINVRGRVRWAAVDKRKARDLLADIRDAESSLDTALSIVTMRIVSRNQASLAALRTSQEMFQPMLANELTKIKQCINEQLSDTVDKNKDFWLAASDYWVQITIHAEATVGESQNKVKAGLNEVSDLIKTIVASGETHSEMLQKLTDLHRGLSNAVNCPNNGIDDQQSQAIASRRRMEGAGYFEEEITLVKAQRSDSTDRGNLAGPSASTAPGSPVSMQLLSYSMKRTRQSLFWQLRSFDTSFSNDKYWPGLDISVMLKSSQIRRKLRLVLRAGLKIIGQQIIQFDLSIRRDAKHWMSLPRLGLSLTPIYIRPADAPIFQACFDRDLEAVRYLIDTGQATIHDVDSESRRGLLEHAFRTTAKPTDYPYTHTKTKLQLLMRYLLDVGYDPNVFNGLHSLPAILYAFRYNKLDSVTQLIYRGAEIDSFSVNPTTLFWDSQQSFFKKLNILTSIGFSDWKVESGRSLLHGAAVASDWKSLLFALEIYDTIALGAALIECGADINDGVNDWHGPLLCFSISWENHMMAHFSLYCRANLHFTNCHAGNAWYAAWETLRELDEFQFVQHELLLTHLLLHGADPFEPAGYIRHDCVCGSWVCIYTDKWYSYAKQVKCPGFARAWSFSPHLLRELRPSAWKGEIEQDYEAFEVDRVPRITIDWSINGWVVRRDPVPHDDGDTDKEGEVSDEEHSDSSVSDNGDYDEDVIHIYDNGDIRDHYIHDRDFSTLFYQNISTAEGRQRMSTFPAVQLLCNALNRAGYRAEMDSEGEIWFEDEDGDMYFDALEFQSDTEDHEPKFECYICRDMRKYGLSGILDEIERGKQKVYTYREEVKAGKRKWCM